jgi:hypothetical protein
VRLVEGDKQWDTIPRKDRAGVLTQQPTKGLPKVDDCGGDRQTWNSKVRARTRDTRFIQVRTAKVANPTSCLGDQVWHPALRVGLSCPARYPTLLYIVQGAGF